MFRNRRDMEGQVRYQTPDDHHWDDDARKKYAIKYRPVNHPLQRQLMTDDISWDDDSENERAAWVALFAEPRQPTHAELLTQYPQFTWEINALAYYYGLIPPEEESIYTPKYDRYLRFFNPEEDPHPNQDISQFSASLAAIRKP